MWVTAITGDIGAGKSTVARIFSEMGAVRIDADAIAKGLWQRDDIMSKAVARWGNEIVPDGKPNLKRIAEIIFSDPKDNRFACELLHPEVSAIMEEQTRTIGGWIVAEIPLLFESSIPHWINRTIYVTAPLEQRLARCEARGWSRDEVESREKFFLPTAEKIKRSDFLIKNEGSLEELTKKLGKLAKNFKERATGTIEACLSLKFIDLLLIVGRHAEDMNKRAFLVGGAVRDILLNRDTHDIDIVIEGNAISLLHRMYKQECKPKEWDMNFYKKYGSGTLTNKLTGLRIDLVSTRSESFEEIGKRPKMIAGNIYQDLKRRDFTVNSIAMAINKKDWGRIFDPLNGSSDIKSRLLRVLHDKSFIDDPTRILRGVRFEQRLGFKFEEKTFRLLKEAVRLGALEMAVPSRLEKEWKLCQAENMEAITNRLNELGVDMNVTEL